MILTFIFLFVDSYIIIKNGNSKEKIKAKIESCEKIIEEEKERIKEFDVFSVEKLIKKKDILINELTKLKEDNNNFISKRNDDFLEFRKKHYNKDIEKFLLDMELPEVLKEYGIDFKSVNNNSKIKDGKVEDYIDYFIDNK